MKDIINYSFTHCWIFPFDLCFCVCMLLACMWRKEAIFKVFFYLLTTLYFLVQPKYIQALIDKAKQREREQEIVYERKLAKERDKDDHLFADKDKFVTSAYKKKLAEQAKWLEEERLRQLREEKDDVCLLSVRSSSILHAVKLSDCPVMKSTWNIFSVAHGSHINLDIVLGSFLTEHFTCVDCSWL